MGFFRRSGNDRGFFPDSPIEEEKSLFTNDDQRGPLCPCSIADGEIILIPQPGSCPIPDPVISPVIPEDFEP